MPRACPLTISEPAMSFSFGAETRDSLSNLAASLGAGKDKAAGDAFFVFDLPRSQIDAMYRGDWLARKVVDIVPYDMVREWRTWSGHAAEVARAEAAERRLGLRVAVQRALVLGRLYGGGAIVVGTGETDPAALACPLDDEWLKPGGLKFLHVVSRWQLGAAGLSSDPLSPWCGEPAFYDLAGSGRAPLRLHPSRVVRFLGNPLPDPWTAASPWSDSVLQALYDAVHAAALTTAGATSLMHEAKVDVVTVPNLSEHLSSAETTAQLSARFAYAAAMKSINNLLLLGDGETWSRQAIDFGGLPEMVRTFLQVAAGAADIPVTRLLGQSPSGLSATGESDTRNYYDMIAARQELDLRPQLERLDRLMLRSAGLDPGALTFAFRPLWQLDAASAAAIALQKAQATQIYAGLKLWPAAVTARLVEAQLVQDGTYPSAAAIFAEAEAAKGTSDSQTLDYDPSEPRDLRGRWSRGGTGAAGAAGVSAAGGGGTGQSQPGDLAWLLNQLNPVGVAQAQTIPPEEPNRRLTESTDPAEREPGEVVRIRNFVRAWQALKEIDPTNRDLAALEPPGYVPTEADVARMGGAAREAAIQRVCDFVRPNGQPIGREGTSPDIRILPGGLVAAQSDFDYLSVGGMQLPMPNGSRILLPGGAGFVMLRPITSTPNSPAVDINLRDVFRMKIHY